MRFELIKEFADRPELLPTRATGASAGYDFKVAKDTVLPAFVDQSEIMFDYMLDQKMSEPLCLADAAKVTKTMGCKPTLVPTGVKAQIEDGCYLQLSVRSSCPLKHWLILANGVGIIDSDYYNNPDNEGHIFFQIINLFPHDIILREGDKIGQGIILPFYITDDDEAIGDRLGGFGSTN